MRENNTYVLREFSETGPLPPADASIVQVYDHADREVLILGEPGAGKTTLLLELTRDLLDRARQDEAHPIPVVFPLSSWATTRQPLTQWLASELHTRYQVSPPLATSWIETDQVLPLLDGLDEVAAPHRLACVEVINTYRQAHGLLPTVVCSRQADYLALSTRLLLRMAVVIQSLTPEQIESSLASGGERLEALRRTGKFKEVPETILDNNHTEMSHYKQAIFQMRNEKDGPSNGKSSITYLLFLLYFSYYPTFL